MNTFGRIACCALVLATAPALQGCLATKVVTVPVKAAYGAGKLVVKGTAAAVRAVVPDDEEQPAAQEPDPKDPPADTPPDRPREHR